MSNTIQAPTTKQISKELSKHNDIRVDEFYWLKDRENQELKKTILQCPTSSMAIGTSQGMRKVKIIRFTPEKKNL
jgi:protease II